MASAFPQGPIKVPKPGPGGHYGAEHYFHYTNVNAPKDFEWGYRRGNDPEHFREEYLSQKAHTFKAKVRDKMCSILKLHILFGDPLVLLLLAFFQNWLDLCEGRSKLGLKLTF